MHRSFGRLALLLFLALPAATVACASRASSAAQGRQRPDLITKDQFDPRYTNALEVVQALRANWLQVRGSDSFRTPSQVVVMVDNLSMGGIGALRSIRLDQVEFIRHYDAGSASAKWGTGYGGGVIYVSTRKEETR